MRLDYILSDIPGIAPIPEPAASTVIAGITCDPNLCRPDFLYLAAESETVDSTRYGVRLDGRDYIDTAVRNGATVVLTTPHLTIPREVRNKFLLLTHEQPLSILGKLCAQYFGERPKKIALVTGTNGKTSTVNFARMLWSGSGRKSCSVGNLGGVCSDGTIVWDRDPTLSVPETVFMHDMLRKLARRGFNHVALEATSHALFDYRLHGLPATIAAFTNLTRDHLDFHQTMEEYFRVKMLLFKEVLPRGSFAVLNADTPWSDSAIAICKDRNHEVLSFGKAGAAIKLLGRASNAQGQELALEILGERFECQFNLHGEFQTSNALCALGIVIASGVSAAEAIEQLSQLQPVEGRMNTVAFSPTGGRIIVDYAHTPDGIRAALEACRSITEGKLFVVFGCNGERDAGKRSEMGEIAAKLADRVIVTDAHPRTENPEKIRRQILEAAEGAEEVPNRISAIDVAIRELGPKDTVLVAGLGHEKFRTIGTIRVPYSDTETVHLILAELGREKH